MLNQAEILTPHFPASDAAMDDERRSESPGRRESDHKPSPWVDPRLWASVLGLFLTIVMGLLSYISSQLASVNADVKAMNAYVKATNDAVLVVTTKQAADDEALRERVAKLESAVATQQQAYNFNFTTRLAVVESRAGIKPPAEKD